MPRAFGVPIFNNRPTPANRPQIEQMPYSPMGRPSPLGKPVPWNTSQLPTFEPALEQSADIQPLIGESTPLEREMMVPRKSSGLQVGSGPDNMIDYIPGKTTSDDIEAVAGMKVMQGSGFGQEWDPASQGTVSAPGGSDDAAHDKYKRNMGWATDEEIAKENMEVARAEALEQAYKGGNLNPTGSGQGYARALSDQNGNIVGYIDKSGNPVQYPQAAGRMGAKTYEERAAIANRGISTNLMNRLGELAKKHEAHIGPYASKWVGLQRSGYIPGMEAPDPEVAEMYTIAADLQNKQVYEQSGKQINEAEFARLKQTMPRLDQDPVSFWAAYNNFLQQLHQRGISLAGQDPLNMQQPVNPNVPTQGQARQARIVGVRRKA